MCLFFTHNNRKKNNLELKDVPELTGRYQIIDKENKLIISQPELRDAGKYTCSIPELEETAEINVVGTSIAMDFVIINIITIA